MFAKHQLIALADPVLVGINCGVVYAHNAHPAGPTAWAAAQVPDRTLRWLENQPFILDALGAPGEPERIRGMGYEQSVFNDAVWSIVSGQPVFAHSLRPEGAAAGSAWERFHDLIGPKRVKTEVVRARCAPWSLRIACAIGTQSRPMA